MRSTRRRSERTVQVSPAALHTVTARDARMSREWTAARGAERCAVADLSRSALTLLSVSDFEKVYKGDVVRYAGR